MSQHRSADAGPPRAESPRRAQRRRAAPRRSVRRTPHGLFAVLALVVGVAVSVYIVVVPSSNADGLSSHTATAGQGGPAKPSPGSDSQAGSIHNDQPDADTNGTTTDPKSSASLPHWPYASRCPERALACVDLTHKVSWLQTNGVVMYGPIRVEPGSPGQVTPKGVFTVQRKDKHHISGEFNEPMPDAIFFAPGGIAFHVGSLTKGSHGCVHLTTRDANYYWNQLRIGATVAVF